MISGCHSGHTTFVVNHVVPMASDGTLVLLIQCLPTIDVSICHGRGADPGLTSTNQFFGLAVRHSLDFATLLIDGNGLMIEAVREMVHRKLNDIVVVAQSEVVVGIVDDLIDARIVANIYGIPRLHVIPGQRLPVVPNERLGNNDGLGADLNHRLSGQNVEERSSQQDFAQPDFSVAETIPTGDSDVVVEIGEADGLTGPQVVNRVSAGRQRNQLKVAAAGDERQWSAVVLTHHISSGHAVRFGHRKVIG